VDPVSHLSTPMGCRNPLSHNADYCHCEFRRGCTQRRDPISGAAVSACKCGCDDRRAQSAPASDPRRSGTEGGTGPRRALYSPVSSRRSGLTRRGSRARSPNANSNHRREHTALRFRNQSLECIPQSIPRVPGKLRNLFLVATGKAAYSIPAYSDRQPGSSRTPQGAALLALTGTGCGVGHPR
jgi:hypothetical protein